MKKILIIFFFLASCGYQPLYIQKEELFFKKINLIGDKKINRKIISSSTIKKNTQSDSNNELILETNKDIIITSRNSKGQPATFKSLIEVKFTIKEDGKILKQKIFNESFDYNNIENKYDLSVYQTDIEDNLINKIVEDLIIYMNIK
jgi:hypothetical protein|tara:strand:- start:260 stop:700 length:441 start_codon:yes stop_codon:yes gene_type:complete